MKNNEVYFQYSSFTSRGIRAINEDSLWVGKNESGQILAMVCDGIGSQNDSQIASIIAVDVFSTDFQKHKKIKRPNTWFDKCLKTAHKLISNKSNVLYGKKIGTTLNLCLIDNKHVSVFNLGDSRTFHYKLNEDKWYKITTDQNLYNYFLKLKNRKPETKIDELIKQYKDQLYALTDCLESNSESYKNYDTYSFEIEPGDVVFIASDGTYHFIELSNVNKIIRDNIDKNFMANSKLIVQEALENKSNDNCSSIVIECVNVNE